jgi:hypothetical protein
VVVVERLYFKFYLCIISKLLEFIIKGKKMGETIYDTKIYGEPYYDIQINCICQQYIIKWIDECGEYQTEIKTVAMTILND